MNELRLPKNLAFLGNLTLGVIATTGISIISAQKAYAASAYAYSQADVFVNIQYNGSIDVPWLEVETSTSSGATVEDTPGGDEIDVDEFNALQSYVGPPPAPPQNFFSPKGQETPDYARGDTVINDLSLTSVEGQNLGETFVESPISETVQGDQGEGFGTWEWGTDIFTAAEGDSIEFFGEDLNPEPGEDKIFGSYSLAVQIEDGNSLNEFAESEFDFAIKINQIENGAATEVFGLDFERAIGLTNPGGPLEQGDSIIFNDDSTEFQFEEGQYEIVIEAVELADVRVNEGVPVPEPATILGLLTVGGLGLGLKCKKQL